MASRRYTRTRIRGFTVEELIALRPPLIPAELLDLTTAQLIALRREEPEFRIHPDHVALLRREGRMELLTRQELIRLRLSAPGSNLSDDELARLRRRGRDDLIALNEIITRRIAQPSSALTLPDLVRMEGITGLMQLLNHDNPTNPADIRIRTGTRRALAELLAPAAGNPELLSQLGQQLYELALQEAREEIQRRRDIGVANAFEDTPFLRIMPGVVESTADRRTRQYTPEGVLRARGITPESLTQSLTTAFNTVFNRVIAEPDRSRPLNEVVRLLTTTVDPRAAPLPGLDTTSDFTPENMVRTRIMPNQDEEGGTWRMSSQQWMLAVLNHPDPAIRGRYRIQLARLALQDDTQLGILASQIHRQSELELRREVDRRMQEIEARFVATMGQDAFRDIIANGGFMTAMRTEIEALARHERTLLGAGTREQILTAFQGLRSSLTDVEIIDRRGTIEFGERFRNYQLVMDRFLQAQAAAITGMQDHIPIIPPQQLASNYDSLVRWGNPPNYRALEIRIWSDMHTSRADLSAPTFWPRLWDALEGQGIRLDVAARAAYMQSFLQNLENPAVGIQTHLAAAAQANRVNLSTRLVGMTVPADLRPEALVTHTAENALAARQATLLMVGWNDGALGRMIDHARIRAEIAARGLWETVSDTQFGQWVGTGRDYAVAMGGYIGRFGRWTGGGIADVSSYVWNNWTPNTGFTGWAGRQIDWAGGQINRGLQHSSERLAELIPGTPQLTVEPHEVVRHQPRLVSDTEEVIEATRIRPTGFAANN